MPKYNKRPLRQRRRLQIAWNASEQYWMVESRSRNGFYHDVVHFVDGGWSCDCHKFTMEVSMQSKNDCRHIKIVKYYLSNEWWLIDFVIASYAIKKLYT